MQKKQLIRLLVIFSTLGNVFPGAAQQVSSPDSWNFTLSSFLHQGINVSGTVNTETGSTGLSFSDDFLEQDTNGQKIQLTARKKDWTLYADYQYFNPDPGTGALPDNELLDLRAQITRLGASYRFATWNGTDFEILAGTRYRVEGILTIQDIGDHSRRIENDEWWRNTFVGVRFFSRISENWSFVGRGDVALGNAGKDIGWNAVAMFDYRLGGWGSFYFGYKLFALDEKNVDTGMERYSYDALQQGPFIGLNIRW